MVYRHSLNVLLVGFFVLVTSASAAFAEIDAELLKRAKAGDVMAQFRLGSLYSRGEGVVQDDAEAVKWYRKAAEQGYDSAQNNLGVMYESGEGVAQDYAEAVKWYRKSAEQGDGSAQNNLARMYHDGYGAAQDYVLAHMWWILARAQGYEIVANKGLANLPKKMTKEQVADAQKMAREWQARDKGVE